MRPAALLLLLLTACASSPTAVIDHRTFRCGPGQDIEVRAGLDDGSINHEAAGELKYLVEVANNSHGDVTVKSIWLQPRGNKMTGVDTVSRTFDQLIPENEEHVFEIPASDAWSRTTDFDRRIRSGTRLEFDVRVGLTNGDSYHCSFEAQWR